INSRMSARVNACSVPSNSCAVSSMPDEQNPHCAALRSAKADCNSASAPLSDIPSIVSIRLPSACTAKIKHPRVILPSTNTEHAPQTPCSHPRWVPVSSSSSRRKSARCWRGLTTRRSCLPLITVSISSSYCIRRLPPEDTSRPIYRFRTVPNDGRGVNPHSSAGHSTAAHALSLEFQFACENTALVTSEADDVRGCQSKRLRGNGALSQGHSTHTARNLRRRREA